MSIVKEIVEGWTNYFIADDQADSETINHRAKTCGTCEFAVKGKVLSLLPDLKLKEIQGRYCGVCKCPLSPKVRSKDSECPENKW